MALGAVLALAGVAMASTATASPTRLESLQRLLGDFDPGWRMQWREQRLNAPPTRFRVETEAGNEVLRADSQASASALIRQLPPRSVPGRVAWRWKVAHSLADNAEERARDGDDYAARVFVIFGGGTLGRRTRALCYVWAGNEPVGTRFPSPYAGGVTMIVLRSGDDEAGAWRSEDRDAVADYRTVYGEDPGRVGAVAVMVDTDDTGATATAWFDDVVVTPGGASGAR